VSFREPLSEPFVGRLVRFKAPCGVPTCGTLRERRPSEIPNTLKLVKRNCRKDCTVFTVILFTDLRARCCGLGWCRFGSPFSFSENHTSAGKQNPNYMPTDKKVRISGSRPASFVHAHGLKGSDFRKQARQMKHLTLPTD
jgi:hypothetical protein